ncbi:MAG: hypothetical protein IKJ42_03795, partial [Bacteroidaceae bacterium]|nr:hypothetical protein [Bacteroidaceae bacterium]
RSSDLSSDLDNFSVKSENLEETKGAIYVKNFETNAVTEVENQKELLPNTVNEVTEKNEFQAKNTVVTSLESEVNGTSLVTWKPRS